MQTHVTPPQQVKSLCRTVLDLLGSRFETPLWHGSLLGGLGPVTSSQPHLPHRFGEGNDVSYLGSAFGRKAVSKCSNWRNNNNNFCPCFFFKATILARSGIKHTCSLTLPPYWPVCHSPTAQGHSVVSHRGLANPRVNFPLGHPKGKASVLHPFFPITCCLWAMEV